MFHARHATRSRSAAPFSPISFSSSVLGIASGAVAGLVAITPASGFVGVTGAFVIGIAAGVLCFFAATTVKKMFGYDKDELWNTVIKTYPNVSQFGQFNKAEFLQQPVYSRDFPPCKFCE